jgi:NADH-quinone oxidoreductase subunit A
MDALFLTPPVVFIIVLGASLGLSAFLSSLSFKPKTKSADCGKSYACGEDVATNLMQPDYTEFFPFAFFFTILHVVTLIIATVPVNTMQSLSIAVLYLLGAVVAMFILFRKW